MSLKVVLGIIIKLDGGRSLMISRDGSRSGRFFLACLKEAEEIFHKQSYSMLTVYIGQRELSAELIAGISYTRHTFLLLPIAGIQLL